MKAALILALSPIPAAIAPITPINAPGALQGTPSAVFSAPSIAPALSAPALLPAPAISPVLSAAPALQTPARALPALSALSVLPAPSIGDAFDGAFAERREKKAEAVQHAREEIPVVDALRGRYSKEGAAEMLEASYDVAEGKTMTGVELLSLVVTPESLHPDLRPDPDRVDFSRLGKTSAQIRETLEEKGVPYHPYERWLGAAFREGLIYRLFNRNTGLTYYGVPPQVRADWGLEPAPEKAPEKEKPAAFVETPFSKALAELAREAEGLPHREELFEFTASAVAAAVKEGRLKDDAASPAFKERAARLDYDVPSLRDAVLTLEESAEGTPWEGRTAELRAAFEKL